jgi:hypothetical protein
MEKTELEPVVLRQVGNSLYLRVPAHFVRANQLRARDVIIMDPAKSFRIVKAEDFALLGRNPVLEPAE